MEVEEEEEEEEQPKAELTEEEKKVWFHPGKVRDLTGDVLNQAFVNFSLPKKDEGFDDVRFEWGSEAKSTEYLRKWVSDRKKTSRMEDLKPSQWFHDKLKDWQRLYAELQ